jgi:hypothetical protein
MRARRAIPFMPPSEFVCSDLASAFENLSPPIRPMLRSNDPGDIVAALVANRGNPDGKRLPNLLT